MTISAQSRYSILDAPILEPGTCFTCGSAGNDDGRKFLDFGKQIDWFGAVYLCTECIREIAEALGFLPVDKFNELFDINKNLQISLDQANASNQRIRDVYADLFADRVDLPTSVDDVLDIGTDSTATVDEVLRDTVSGDSEPKQDSSVEGSDDFFNLEDFDDDGEK